MTEILGRSVLKTERNKTPDIKKYWDIVFSSIGTFCSTQNDSSIGTFCSENGEKKDLWHPEILGHCVQWYWDVLFWSKEGERGFLSEGILPARLYNQWNNISSTSFSKNAKNGYTMIRPIISQGEGKSYQKQKKEHRLKSCGTIYLPALILLFSVTPPTASMVTGQILEHLSSTFYLLLSDKSSLWVQNWLSKSCHWHLCFTLNVFCSTGSALQCTKRCPRSTSTSSKKHWTFSNSDLPVLSSP